ncbi:MAG TPA: Clp protease N-terminal domain-containing protein [Candidatus Hodarchaeales archaeon]|nr:Clp protease N-terminal domain-containing protein [Candidatus Hodarchaeales archaeon]
MEVRVIFERFTERARQVIVCAQDEARKSKHNYIGVEHILLGLIREEEGLGARTLVEFGISLDETREQVRNIIGEGAEYVTGQIPFTPRAKKVLEMALREALSIGHNYIGTEHILLGLLREDEGVAAIILREKGLGLETGRQKILEYLTGRHSDPDDQIRKALAQIKASVFLIETLLEKKKT